MDYLKQHEIFLKKAKSDIAAAKIILKAYDVDLDLDVVMFHLQQAAEKFIKSLLSFNKLNFPKTHDIEKIIKICIENNISFPEYVEEFIDLTDFAVEGRYAMIHDDIEEFQKYVKHLEEFRSFVEIEIRKRKYNNESIL